MAEALFILGRKFSRDFLDKAINCYSAAIGLNIRPENKALLYESLGAAYFKRNKLGDIIRAQDAANEGLRLQFTDERTRKKLWTLLTYIRD